MNREELSDDLTEKLNELIDSLCEYVGKNELTTEEVKHWFIPLLDRLFEARIDLMHFHIPAFLEKEASDE